MVTIPAFSRLQKAVLKPWFPKAYAVSSLAILLATTLLWAILGAKLQQSNADQLVNVYLFGHSATLHGATLPGQHTFLFKWPLFLLIKLFGSSAAAFIALTVGVVIVTVGSLVAVIYRIERRPLVFGTLCLALASVLLLVPTQPYPGGILPVNMAMLTTRNLEYILYIASLIMLIRWPRIKSWGFWLAIACLALLIASDKLFLTISLGGALLALIVYARAHSWNMVSSFINWLISGAVATALAIGLLLLVNASGITHIGSQSGAGPYALVHSAHGLALGVIYAGLGLLTNFGANPAFDATILRNIPDQLQTHLISTGGVTFLINGVILAAGLFMALLLIASSFSQNKKGKSHFDTQSILSIMLIWSTIAAFGSFILSNHYYAVDARYLTISLFALFIAAATFISKRSWLPEKVVLVGLVIALGIVFGLPATIQNYKDDREALATINARDLVITQALASHPVDTLVGDYWRVLPTELSSGNKLDVTPLAGCTQARNVLSSTAWQPNLRNHSFAYLLSLDGSLTDYPRCSIKQVTSVYGRPNASILIAGSLSQPKELLLFYDHGERKSAPKTSQLSKLPTTVLPITIDQLPYTSCSVPTIMNIVAHQDDDLLFMNPDLVNDIKAGHCVRTVYVTAGDSGNGQFYWLNRERGSEAAYSNMIGSSAIWIQRVVKLSSHEFISVANPQGNSRISLIFMHLPDGNLKGDGFKTSNYESLEKLSKGKLNLLHTVDGQSSYTSSQLVAALSTLLHTYQPAEIRTQANYISTTYPDHSDHMAVGSYVKKSYKQFEDQQYGDQVIIPLRFYIGYPIHQMPANVSGSALAQKEATFLDYAKFDSAACQTLQQCQRSPTYGAYLTREYQNTY